MQGEQSLVSSWVRQELATRYGEVAREELPQSMLDLLRQRISQD